MLFRKSLIDFASLTIGPYFGNVRFITLLIKGNNVFFVQKRKEINTLLFSISIISLISIFFEYFVIRVFPSIVVFFIKLLIWFFRMYIACLYSKSKKLFKMFKTLTKDEKIMQTYTTLLS